MGAPRRNRRTYDKPKDIWNIARINADNALIKEFGLKSMKELWKAQYELSRLRGNVRKLLAGTGSVDVEKRIVGRLARLGIVPEGTPLEKLLDLNEQAFLSRRLQTVVLKKGLAKSARQARQLIVHGFIAINGRKVDRPGYMVLASEEQGIGYFKHIDIVPMGTTAHPEEGNIAAASAASSQEAAPAAA